MDRKLRRIVFSLMSMLILFVSACVPATLELPISITTSTPIDELPGYDFTNEEIAILNSLEKVDDYPLYTMRYYGSYVDQISSFEKDNLLLISDPQYPRTSALPHEWSCSLFAALGEVNHMLYGRNFDWEYSPAVILFANPPDGYASVSMVDIAYLGFEEPMAGILTDLPIEERQSLLLTPFLPFDGMNEHGLVVGMAAVPPGQMTYEPNKKTIDSLMVIRKILDQASSVDEAVAVIKSYNIDMGGGPPLHYLIAAPTGRSALVEFYKGEIVVIYNENPWHLATNYLLASVAGSTEGECWRFDEISHRLADDEGQIILQQAIELLEDVSQDITQWSIVYGMSTLEINVAMGRQYENVHYFNFDYSNE
jgi:hypothetical protein